MKENVEKPFAPELPQKTGSDPKCNGQGWLWEDAYGNRVTCWRCAGTGNVPNLIPIKANGPIVNEGEAVGEGIDGTFLPNEEATNEGTQG